MVAVIIISTRECGGQSAQTSREGILLVVFYNVSAPVKPLNGGCLGFQVSRQDLFKPDSRGPAAAPEAKEKEEKGWGRAVTGGMRWRKSAHPRRLLLGPSQIPRVLQCGPSPGPGRAFCPFTWFATQTVTSSCWQLVPAINTVTEKRRSCEASLALEQLLPSPHGWGTGRRREPRGQGNPETIAQGTGYSRGGFQIFHTSPHPWLG